MFFSKEDKTLLYTKDDTFFKYGDETILFDKVVDLYESSVANYTNAAYEKRELYVSVILDISQKKELRADSVDMDGFIVLNNLYEALLNYRTKNLVAEFAREGKLAFKTSNDEMKFVFEDEKLKVIFNKSKRSNSKDFFVDEIIQISNYYSISGEGENEKIPFDLISYKALFRAMSAESVGFSFAQHTKGEALFLKYFKVVFVIFGLNGMGELWFETSLFSHTEPIETLSLVAGMILSLALFVFAPLYWVADKLNAKKLKYEDAQLRGEDVNTKEFNTDYSNLILFVLVAGLGAFIYGSYF